MVDAESVLIEMARQQGHELNSQDKLVIRISVAACLAAKKRHGQRMSAKSYQWSKPKPPR
ncbi:hypothetical protein G9400_03255 [Klebsiella michiganensis]|uniref:hypothetical protein n=1 Tax=Klebsiella quasipneumoniae TaxID=1463165 RepID=UPI000B415854|nr:hypothetical protein [Klebsiella quasipneumoniae]NHE79279.1 hypothetical protein [Klebsiella michiganensis]OVY26894.1 hypothetical protein BME69_25680 [Klebsiella quasipneumoniae subsp. quasipneumoniae]